MAKDRTSFLCSECGAVQAQWAGRCPECGEWDVLAPFTEPAAGTDPVEARIASTDPRAPAPTARPITSIELGEVPRIASGIEEVDRVLGGGFVPGASILLGGDPGVGKSTLLMQIPGALSKSLGVELYASSEDRAAQLRHRADRLRPTT
ncbi:MAG: ATPase domain-containing protein, partial [Planctomycetota bacterium]|nr:ATPase domain-containing protein [Planctomycetota bacterium]